MLITPVIVFGTWIGANLIHSAWIKVRLGIWKRGVIRAKTGLLEHAEPFSCGQGDPGLIFIHGFADLPYGWKRIIRQLTNTHDFACHAMRIPRWGEPLDHRKEIDLEEIRAAIDLEIAELSRQHSKVWLVGHSLGCAFAIDALPRNSEAIAGLVMLAPLIRVSNKRVPLFNARFWYHLGTKVLCLAQTFESPFSARVEATDDPSFNYIVDKFIPYSVYDIVFALTKSNRKIDIPAKMPVFCAVSSHDKVVDTAAAQEWFDGIQGTKEIYVDEVADHALHQGANWIEITEKFGEFIEENS